MAEAETLHVCQSTYEGEKHLLNLLVLPVEIHLLPLTEDVLQILPMLDKLTHYPDPVRIVHRLVEEVPVKLDHIWMILRFEQLHCFFL